MVFNKNIRSFIPSVIHADHISSLLGLRKVPQCKHAERTQSCSVCAVGVGGYLGALMRVPVYAVALCYWPENVLSQQAADWVLWRASCHVACSMKAGVHAQQVLSGSSSVLMYATVVFDTVSNVADGCQHNIPCPVERSKAR